jgi:hypothetical protein
MFWYGYQSWFIVLALRLLRQPVGAGGEDGSRNGKQTVTAEWVTSAGSSLNRWCASSLGILD